MTWLSAFPVALVTASWVLLPGLTVVHLLGVRGIAAAGAAPAVSIGTLALTAVVAGWLGVPWLPGTALAGVLVVAVLAAVLRRPTRGQPVGGSEPPDPHRNKVMAVAAVLGTAVAAAAAVVTAASGLGGPDRLSQTYDAVFHYNAVRQILDGGNGSSLAVGALTDPTAGAAFYPAAWHDLVVLVVQSSATPVPVAANVTAIVIAAVIWPLSCLFLVRQLTGPSVAAVAVTPVVATGFIAFPWSLMGFGVLWPNLLGLALVPVGLALVLTVCGVASVSGLPTGRALLIGLATVVALALAHPNTLFSLAVLATAPIGWWLAARVREAAGADRWLVVAGWVAAVLVTAAAAVYLVILSPLLANLRTFDWPAFESPPQAAGEVLLNATNGREAAWALSLAVVIGAVAASRSRSTRWLVPAHLASAALFLMAAASENAAASALTGLWYNDSYRLAAMVPVTGVPIVVLGLLAVGTWSAGRLRPDPARADLRAGLATVAATALLVGLSSGLYLREHADYLRTAYTTSAEATVLTEEHRAFLNQVAALVPPDDVVAQNPWTGSALLWALSDRRVLFPHLDGRWNADQRYLATHLDKAGRDPGVCAAAERLDVHYVLTGAVYFWPWDPRSRGYPGIDRTAPSSGVELLATDGSGTHRLYRLTACAVGSGTAS